MREMTKDSLLDLFRSRRLLLVFGIALYAGSFLVAYRLWLSPVFGYLGFLYQPMSAEATVASWVFCLLPCLWIPIDLKRPTMLIYWVLYLTVYVPSMFVPFFIQARPDGDVVTMVMALAGGMFILSWTYKIPLLRLRGQSVPPRLFWTLVAIATLILIVGIVIKFKGQMKLVSMEDIYGQRAESKEVLKGSYVGYFVTLLQGMLAPFLMAFALVKRKHLLYLGGFLIQVLVYACTASKAALASALFSLVFFFLIRKTTRNFGISFTWGLAMFTGAVTLAATILPRSPGDVVFKIANVLILRTIGSPGLAAGQYQGFFANHPYTHLSHVNGVNWVMHYPYAQSLGITVGNYFTGRADLNANANMWITDGLAAFGLPGILWISLFAVFIFWLADSAAQKHSVVFGAVVLVYAAVNLSNVSLFTTLISGGMLPLLIMLAFMPKVDQERSSPVS